MIITKYVSNHSKNTNYLIIANIQIRQDNKGCYCLNDCHHVSGMGETKRPSNWVRTQSTKDLIG